MSWLKDDKGIVKQYEPIENYDSAVQIAKGQLAEINKAIADAKRLCGLPE